MANQLIQLRLPPDEVAELRKAAAVARRTVQGEIRNRLLEPQPRKAEGTDRALGELAAIIAARASAALARYELPAGDSIEARRSQLLGLVRDALAFVLNGLGAAASSEIVGNGKDFTLATGISWDLIMTIKSAPRPIPNGDPEWIDTSFADRIGEALGFRQAKVVSKRKGVTKKPPREKA